MKKFAVTFFWTRKIIGFPTLLILDLLKVIKNIYLK